MESYNYPGIGEDVSTTSVVVARRWSDLYRELASFDQTVRRLKQQVTTLSGARRRDAVRGVLPGLITDSENFERRSDFWQERAAQLGRRGDPGLAAG